MNALSNAEGDIETLFNKTKGNLFFKRGAGFLGALLCKISFKWDSNMPTAAISDSTLYWNPEFFLGLDKDTRITVLAHELWHNGLMHGARRGERCPDIWNIAADHVINNMLQDHGYYMEGFPYCMDPKYKGWSTDEVYDDLVANGKPQPIPGGLDGDILPMEDKAAIDKAIADVVGAMASARMTNQAGDIPGEVGMIIDQFLNPKLPWEVILFNFFNALTSEEYSYARPNRRYQDPLLPGVTGRNGLEHLVYFVDISGSITDDQVLRMNSEVKYIQEELRPERLTLMTFDTEIHDTYEFEIDEPFDKIEIHGRGGTHLGQCWDYLQRNAPTAAVVFTDLCVGIPPDPGIPIIWVCTDHREAEIPPYGQLIHVET